MLTTAQAWEFKHPEFKANNKDSLDNIRRKAPAARKPTQISEEAVPTGQIDMMNTQIIAQQQQIATLTERNGQLAVDSQVLLQEVVRMQKNVMQHECIIHQFMNYLITVDDRYRNERRAGAFAGQDGVTPNPVDDMLATPLQQASKILSDMNSQMPANVPPQMDPLSDPSKAQVLATPPLGAAARNGLARAPNSAGSAASMGYTKMNGELENVVYPVGTANGIDPMYSEHVGQIPYSVPPTKELAIDASDGRRQYPENRKKPAFTNPGWIKQPQILLVEDDVTCRHIGGKFLGSFKCNIEYAVCILQPRHVVRPNFGAVRRTRGRQQGPVGQEIRFDFDGYYNA